jgi:hypothetical protein
MDRGAGFLASMPRFFPNALHHLLSRQIRHAVRSAIASPA